MARKPAQPDLESLLPSWELHLRAERKSPATIKSYGDGVRAFFHFCGSRGRPVVLDRPTVNAFVAHLLDTGAQPTTARARQLTVRRFSAWAFEEGELSDDALLGLKAPKLDVKVVEPLSDDEVRAMVRACAGQGCSSGAMGL